MTPERLAEIEGWVNDERFKPYTAFAGELLAEVRRCHSLVAAIREAGRPSWGLHRWVYHGERFPDTIRCLLAEFDKAGQP